MCVSNTFQSHQKPPLQSDVVIVTQIMFTTHLTKASISHYNKRIL